MDYRLEQLINAPAGSQPWLDVPMRVLALGAEPAFILLVAVWFGLALWQRSRVDAIGAVTALLASGLALLINVGAALLWDRQRPFVAHPGSVHLLVSQLPDASFPSDHAAAAFAIAVVLTAFHRRAGAVVLLAAALLSYARVYVGVHYPLDVLTGAAIGIVSGLLLHRLYLALGEPAGRRLRAFLAQRQI